MVRAGLMLTGAIALLLLAMALKGMLVTLPSPPLQAGTGFDSLAKWDAYERSLKKSTLPDPVKRAIKTDPEKRNDEQKKQIREYFLQKIYPQTRPTFEALEKQVEELDKQKRDRAQPGQANRESNPKQAHGPIPSACPARPGLACPAGATHGWPVPGRP